MLFARPLAELIAQFERLPGVGPKSAQRLAFHVLRMPKDDVRRLSDALSNAREKLRFCDRCQNVSERELCEICADPKRDPSVICVVAEPRDIAAIERINEYYGLYHVLPAFTGEADHEVLHLHLQSSKPGCHEHRSNERGLNVPVKV